MGYDIELVNQLNSRLTQLEAEVLQLKVANLPRSDIVSAGVQAEKDTADIIGNDIGSAYDVINTLIADEKQKNPVNLDIINELISLKSEVPYHFAFGQKDQVWLNDKINAILGANTSV